jgi:chromosome segregation ATPase
LKSVIALLSSLLIAGSLIETARAETFRWVDDKGAVHYSDQVPPEQAKTRRSKLNARGFEVETVEAPKTREQIEQEQLLKQLRAQQEKVLNEQREHDQALMRTYRSTDEILTALKIKLDSLESNIRLTQANIDRDAQTLAGHEQRASVFTSKGQVPPQATLDSIASLKKRITAYRTQIQRTENEKLVTADQFSRDMKRFQAIKAMQDRHENPNADWTRGVSKAIDDGYASMISVFECATENHCDRYWSLAADYLRRKSGYPIAVETQKILQTPYPRNDTDFGITVTRLTGKTNYILFIDVICRPTNVGEQLCKSSRIREIHQGFRQALLGTQPDSSPSQN